MVLDWFGIDLLCFSDANICHLLVKLSLFLGHLFALSILIKKKKDTINLF